MSGDAATVGRLFFFVSVFISRTRQTVIRLKFNPKFS